MLWGGAPPFVNDELKVEEYERFRHKRLLSMIFRPPSRARGKMYLYSVSSRDWGVVSRLSGGALFPSTERSL